MNGKRVFNTLVDTDDTPHQVWACDMDARILAVLTNYFVSSLYGFQEAMPYTIDFIYADNRKCSNTHMYVRSFMLYAWHFVHWA